MDNVKLRYLDADPEPPADPDPDGYPARAMVVDYGFITDQQRRSSLYELAAQRGVMVGPSHDHIRAWPPGAATYTVELWDIPEAEKDALIDYYAASPAIVLEFHGDSGPIDPPVTPVPPEEPPSAPEPLPDPWDVDHADEVPRRTDLALFPGGRWKARKLSDIHEITVHHIASIANWEQAMRNYLRKGTGRPAPPYSLWIERTGLVRKLLHLTEANWHDHDWPRTFRRLSVGLNGALHLYPPTPEQLDALVRVCVWAIRHPEMQVTRAGIRGHMDITPTQCPGWDARGSGWKDNFFELLDAALDG